MSTTATPFTAGRISDRTVLLVASFGAFLAFLDATIVNVAFPSIRSSFPDSTISSLSWILNAYSIVFAAFLVVSGRIADLLGRRWAFTAGVAIFTGASVVCAAAGSVGFHIAARMVQALGAAILVPASLALVVQAFPSTRRSHAVGLWGASAALASGLGPPIGGALVQAGGWRWAFLVNLPFGIAAWWAGRRLLVESRAPGRRRLPDLVGATLLSATLAVFTLAIVKGEDWGWTSPAVLGCLVGSAALAALFVLSSRRHRSPLIDPALLRIRSFVVGNLATVVAGMGFYAYLLTNILWLQYVWGYTVLGAGLAVVPGAVIAAILAARLGPVAQSRGYRLIIVPGAIVWALAYVWYATRVEVSPDFWGAWLPGQVLSGIGVGATLPVLGSAALAAVPGGRFATASAVNSSARQIGAVLGIAILVVIVGTPSPSTTVGSLRHGWVFSSICFAITALVALGIGVVRARADDEAEETGAPVSVRLPEPTATTSAGALSGSTLFARLPEDVRARLEAAATPIDLPAGQWLFRAGDAASDVYVVSAGRLEVVVGSTTVREVGASAVLGELSLLTGDVRTASVRARRDSHLLRLGHDAFDAVVGQDLAAMTALSSVLAEQLAHPVASSATGAPRPGVVAVVALDPTAPVPEVTDVLRGQLAPHLRVVAPGRLDPDGLDRAERDNDCVLLAATVPGDDWWDRCVRQADLVVFVARTGQPVPDAPPLGRADADLVLVGPREPRDRLAAWVAALSPWRITQADGELGAALRPVGARLAGRSVGLVLGGGGARAFAHIGVLHELADAGVEVDRVAGSSQGSIIAALHASGMGPQEIEDRCYQEFVRGRPFSDYTVPVASVAKGRRTERVLRRNLGDALIDELPRSFRCSSTDLQTRSAHAHRSGPLVEAVMASIALPVLFPPRRDGDRLLADGGILDNLPVRLLTERDEGPLVAVNISMGGGATRREGPGSATASPTRVRVPALGETLLRSVFIGSAGAAEAARAAGALVVTPSSQGVGLLEFHQLDQMVESGRAAGRALLAEAGPLLAR